MKLYIISQRTEIYFIIVTFLKKIQHELLYITYFLKRKNEHINHDLVSSKKTFLHARKTQIIIVEFEFKTITKNLFFGASGQRVGILQCTILLHISKEFGNMGNHYTNITPKLKKAVRPLSKIRHSAPKLLIKIIYYSRSKSQLIYADQIWG